MANNKNRTANGATLGFEQTLWAAADKLRGHLDAAEYKHVVLGLIFLKYISDAFQEQYDDLAAQQEAEYTDPEDRDEYMALNVFWVPVEARWQRLQDNAKSAQIGILIDEAMAAIEKENPQLKGVLPQNYGREDLDKRRLGELIDLIGTMSLGDSASQSQDILGQVYEYFLGQFASAEGKKGGEFYTPHSIVTLLVDMLEPYRGRIYDPCCGAGGMFVQSERFVEDHQGRVGDIAIYGQESNPTTWKLFKMNLAIRGIDGNIGPYAADTFHEDLHPDLKADFILANPPFNVSDWGGELLQEDKRWIYGVPPRGNANFAWVQHMIHHLAAGGRTGFVLANGSMSSSSGGEGNIRHALVEADLVDCMVALPPQLFYNTQIPACLWFLNRAKPPERRGQLLFIDARGLGTMVNRRRRELNKEDITRIATTYHAWREPVGATPRGGPVSRGGPIPRGDPDAGRPDDRGDREPGQVRGPAPTTYNDVPGFCKSATLEEIAAHDFVLTPGRYVGAAELEDDGEPFEEKMERLVHTLNGQFQDSENIRFKIASELKKLGYE